MMPAPHAWTEVDQLARDTRVSASVMQTVGRKGYDRFAIALVLRPG